MISHSPTADAAVLFSGGLDSAVLLGRMLRQGSRVRPIYVASGLVWQRAELRAVRRFLAAIHPAARLLPLVVLDLPLADLYGDHWSVTGRGVPDGDSPDAAVYLPGRNALLTVKAGVWCRLHGVGRLALGVLGRNPFADAGADFFSSFQAALNCGPEPPLEIERPLAAATKRQVMQWGRELPLEETFSCIQPRGMIHCGRCNKCAERQAAFALAGMKDPTPYAAAGEAGQEARHEANTAREKTT